MSRALRDVGLSAPGLRRGKTESGDETQIWMAALSTFHEIVNGGPSKAA